MQLLVTPLLPTYAEAKNLLAVWDGLSRASVLSMRSSITGQTGTPQNPINWTTPDEWIDERLVGDDAKLANKIWKAGVNPRHTHGAYFFLERHELLKADSSGLYRMTDSGRLFIENDPMTMQRIDELQGLYALLDVVSVRAPAKSGAFFDEWANFVKAGSNYKRLNSLKAVFRYALVNLLDRGLIERKGSSYSITQNGAAHLDNRTVPSEAKAQRSIATSVQIYNEEQKKLLLDKVASMEPYRFEHLVKELLDAMDYEDVVVTKQSGDGGVDVVAKFQFGITEVTEVVQVKRQTANVGRQVLDGLRGSLHRFGAIRATIITTSGFAKACVSEALAQGAAPISLIDGGRLVELLCKYRIGVREQHLTLLDFDETYFDVPEEEIAE